MARPVFLFADKGGDEQQKILRLSVVSLKTSYGKIDSKVGLYLY
jgi:hypothetical protein